MSDEASGRRDRRGRRRYFRPKKDDGPPQSKPVESRPEGGKMRRARRRARSRQRSGDEMKSRQQRREEPYIAPAAVFIYTHSADPEMAEAYEFRPEHFSSVGPPSGRLRDRSAETLARRKARAGRTAAACRRHAETRVQLGRVGRMGGRKSRKGRRNHRRPVIPWQSQPESEDIDISSQNSQTAKENRHGRDDGSAAGLYSHATRPRRARKLPSRGGSTTRPARASSSSCRCGTARAPVRPWSSATTSCRRSSKPPRR